MQSVGQCLDYRLHHYCPLHQDGHFAPVFKDFHTFSKEQQALFHRSPGLNLGQCRLLRDHDRFRNCSVPSAQKDLASTDGRWPLLQSGCNICSRRQFQRCVRFCSSDPSDGSPLETANAAQEKDSNRSHFRDWAIVCSVSIFSSLNYF